MQPIDAFSDGRTEYNLALFIFNRELYTRYLEEKQRNTIWLLLDKKVEGKLSLANECLVRRTQLNCILSETKEETSFTRSSTLDCTRNLAEKWQRLSIT